MKIKQLSVFMENRVGVINDVTSILSKSSVNMRAFSVAEGVEFGILRLIVSDTDRAYDLLREAGYAVNTTEVVGIQLPNKPGALSKVMECLAREDVFIQYMYAFSEGESASVVIRPTDIDRCMATLDRCREELIALDSNYKI